MRVHSERPTCPRRGNPKAAEAVLSRGQTERGGKVFWDAEQADRHPASCWGSRIASQPLLKAETRMRALRTGQGRRRDVWVGREGRLRLNLQALASQPPHTCSPMKPPTPIPPEQGGRAHRERMQQQTHPAGFYRLWAMPLTLLAQPTAATVYDPSGVEYPQRAIGLGALLGRVQRLACWTAERPIGLESEVLSREAASFPGGGGGGWAIPRGGSRLPTRLLFDRRDGRSPPRWCAGRSAPADAPTPGGGSTPMARRSASTPDQRATDYTSDRGLARHPHQPEQAQRRRDADTTRRHRRR
jgi:hypothetical protein